MVSELDGKTAEIGPFEDERWHAKRIPAAKKRGESWALSPR